MAYRCQPKVEAEAVNGIAVVMTYKKLILIRRIDDVKLHSSELVFLVMDGEGVVDPMCPNLVVGYAQTAFQNMHGVFLAIHATCQQKDTNEDNRCFHIESM